MFYQPLRVEFDKLLTLDAICRKHRLPRVTASREDRLICRRFWNENEQMKGLLIPGAVAFLGLVLFLTSAAAQERLQISEIVERALADYLQRSKAARPGNVGLMRLLGPEPLKVTDEQLREILELDYFDQ